MTIKVTIKLTPEAKQALGEMQARLSSPKIRAWYAEIAKQNIEQRRAERHAEYFQQARASMLRWDLHRLQARHEAPYRKPRGWTMVAKSGARDE